MVSVFIFDFSLFSGHFIKCRLYNYMDVIEYTNLYILYGLVHRVRDFKRVSEAESTCAAWFLSFKWLNMASKAFSSVFPNLDLNSLVDFDKKSLLISLAAIAFNPTAWNIVARNGQ